MAINICKHCGKTWTAQPRASSVSVPAVCRSCQKEERNDKPATGIKNFSLTRSAD